MNPIPFRERISCTVLEAVAATGIPKPTIYDAIAAGRLECVKVGKRSLILVNSLEQLVNSGSSQAEAV
jgi:excisionase family DNA binding protein